MYCCGAPCDLVLGIVGLEITSSPRGADRDYKTSATRI